MLIWYEPLREAEDLAKWLQTHCAECSVLTDLDLAEVAMSEDGTAQIVLLAAPPRQVFAAALADEKSPEEARVLWQASVSRILAFMRRYRRRAFLLDTEAARAAPEALARLCGMPQVPDDAPPAPSAPTDEVLLILSEILLKETPETNNLVQEFSATAYDLSEGKPPSSLNLPAALNSYLQHRKEENHTLSAQQDQADILHQAFEMNLQDLTRQQERIQEAEARLQAQEQRIRHLELLPEAQFELIRQRDMARDTATALEQDLAEARDTLDLQTEQNRMMLGEMELLQTQHDMLAQRLKQVNAGIESYEARAAELTNRLKDKDVILARKDTELSEMKQRNQSLQAEIETSRATLDQVMNSRSIRITAPLRFVGDTLRRLRGTRG